jgi:hypothetical protein
VSEPNYIAGDWIPRLTRQNILDVLAADTWHARKAS